MQYIYINKESKSIGITTYPLNNSQWLEITPEQYAEYQEKTANNYDCEITFANDTANFKYTFNQQRANENQRAELRQRRTPLLNAFDILKGNFIFGIDQITDEEYEEIVKWYHSLLDLEAVAFVSIPDKVKKYIKGGI